MKTLSKTQPDLEPRFSSWALVNSLLRCLVWLAFLFLVPWVLIPELGKLFEEFGIELPGIAKLGFALADKVHKLWFIAIPLLFAMAVGQEVLLLSLPPGKNRTTLNVIAWFVFLVAIVVFVLGFGMPLVSLWSGLTN